MIYTDPATLLIDQHKCIDILVDALKNGSLNLVIGSGVSSSTKDNGFPSWIELAKKCCLKTGLPFDDNKLTQNKYLLRLLESVRSKCLTNFNDLIKECLYENIDYNLDLLKKDLLIAIGSLVMNSSKSNLNNVINYNFDDVLEWYLSYYGFNIQVVADVNHILSNSDTVIYHPHGFLPKSKMFEDFTSKKILLTNRDYVEANWNIDFWNSIQHSIFSNKVNLFLGLSGEDSHIENICQFCYDKIIDRNRILGIIIKSLKDKGDDIESQNLSNGIVTYYIKDYSELPELLLSISRNARGIS